MAVILGLDVGSSSIKAALLDLDTLSVRAMATRPFPAPLAGAAGRHEVDADEVTVRCRAVIDQLAIDAPPLSGVYLCGQHGGVVPVDAQTRRALGPYTSWRDERAAELHPAHPGISWFEHIRESIGRDDLLRIGREFAPGGTLMLASRLLHDGPYPPGTRMVGIGEYVLSQFTNTDAVIERTCAIGLMDLTTSQQPSNLYERLGIATFGWPRIVTFREQVGELRLSRGRSVAAYPVVGDHQCALAGAALAERELSINVSTGSQVSLLARSLEPSDRTQTRPYFDGLFLRTITHLPAGRALNVLIDLLCELPRRAGRAIENPWALLVPLLEDASAHTNLRVRTTFFKGPLGECGAIENIGTDNVSAGAILHAALLDMADKYREAASWLDAGGEAFDGLALSGGIAQKLSDLRSAIARQFPKRPIRVSQSDEETLRGLMTLALVNAGRAPSVLDAARLLKSS
jgi:sugar (pentulose or hexulose) kinase